MSHSRLAYGAWSAGSQRAESLAPKFWGKGGGEERRSLTVRLIRTPALNGAARLQTNSRARASAIFQEISHLPAHSGLAIWLQYALRQRFPREPVQMRLRRSPYSAIGELRQWRRLSTSTFRPTIKTRSTGSRLDC